MIILGGGPAGTSCAIALSLAGRSVTLFERSRYDSPRVGEALPPEVRQPLTELGLWQRFLADGPLASPGITAAWGSRELRDNDFIMNPFGSGWHVDRRRFDAMLALSAEESGAEVLRAARSTRFARDGPGAWHVDAIAGECAIQRRAAALVDATGRTAAPARRLGSRRLIHDRLIGVWSLTADATERLCTDQRTLIEPVNCGWWYSALLPDGRHAAALMTDADLLPAGSAARSFFWRKCLERAPHTMSRLGPDAARNSFRIVPAFTSMLDCTAEPGWLAVGDAAMSCDPLSARGVTWALVSGLAGARAHDAFMAGDPAATRDFAHRAALDFETYLHDRGKIYARERRWPDSPFWRRRNRAPGATARMARG